MRDKSPRGAAHSKIASHLHSCLTLKPFLLILQGCIKIPKPTESICIRPICIQHCCCRHLSKPYDYPDSQNRLYLHSAPSRSCPPKSYSLTPNLPQSCPPPPGAAARRPCPAARPLSACAPSGPTPRRGRTCDALQLENGALRHAILGLYQKTS